MTDDRQAAALYQILGLRHLLPVLLLSVMSLVSVYAENPGSPQANYIRTHFGPEQGMSSDVTDDIDQSQDGFLWVRENGNSIGRFDGQHFALSSKLRNVSSLAVAPNGDLWVATGDGLKQIPAGSLEQFDHGPSMSHCAKTINGVVVLRFTRTGTLWLGAARGLYRFDQGVCSVAIPGPPIERIEEEANGHLWITTRGGAPMEWDGTRALPHPELAAQLGVKATEIFHVFEDSHGVTWFCTKNGVARRVSRKIEKLEPYGPKGHAFYRAYEAPDGRIWFASDDGLFKLGLAGLELVAPDMQVRRMCADRDGNLWVSTNGDGLYRLRESAVRTFTTANGLPNNNVMTVLAAHDGSLWAGFNCGGVAHFDGHSFRIFNQKNGLVNTCVWSLAEDANYDVWIGTYGGGVFRLHNGKFTQYSTPQGLLGEVVMSVLAARDGSVWLATVIGVSRIQGSQIRNYTAADGLRPDSHYFMMYEDRAGGIWVRSLKGTERLVGDRFEPFSIPGRVRAGVIGQDASGALYFCAYSPQEQPGIFRMVNDQTIQVAPDLDAQQLRDTHQEGLWLIVPGIVRVPFGSLGYSHPADEPVDFEPFGPPDGLPPGEPSGGDPITTLTPDDKLWIATSKGLVSLDLPRMPPTDRRPKIYVDKVTIGRAAQEPTRELVLAAGTNHLELNFEAVEITSPEKIRLQYRMDGEDSEWLDTTPPGHAVYSTLAPGRHAFHMRASNRSGIWDHVGTIYYVTQQPYFYQTGWFLAACVAFGLLLVGVFYQVHVREVIARANMRLEDRFNERMRIARDLHDTLLQSFQGLMLRFQLVEDLLPEGKAKDQLEQTLQRADQAIAEGRRAVYDLRSSTATATDLSEAVRSLGDKFSTENSAAFNLVVEGAARELNRVIRDELYLITREALQNAFNHSRASHIEAEVTYGERQFRLRIRDDGEGIPTQILEEGRLGHYGLSGMRERAKQIGGKLDFWSRVGTGTEIEVSLPGSIAYRPSVARPLFALFARKQDEL